FEAMACEKAVVSVRDDQRHSVHVRDRETGLRVTGTDPAAAMAAMRQGIGDRRLRERLGKAGRRWAQDRLSSKRMADQTADLYDRVLATSSRRCAAASGVTVRPARTAPVPQAAAGSAATRAAASDTGCGSE